MVTRLTLDSAGRVVIPKPLRDELQLHAGDVLDLESDGDTIVLRPARDAVLRKEHGIWVLWTGKPLPAAITDEVLRKVREERDDRNAGKIR
jgi:AbrB family looped-hinge helix DNA binding protein